MVVDTKGSDEWVSSQKKKNTMSESNESAIKEKEVVSLYLCFATKENTALVYSHGLQVNEGNNPVQDIIYPLQEHQNSMIQM